MEITPYKVEGEINYNKVVKEFGASFIDERLKKKFKGLKLVERDYFFAHRDLDKLVGKRFAIVSGRGPSAHMHLAHLMLFKFVKEMQDKFGCYVFIPFSDDEKFLFDNKLSLEETKKLAHDNALDIIALGFDPKKTEFVFDFENMNQDLYNLSIKCSKAMTYGTVKAALGLTNEKNIGVSFYPAMQAAHILYPTYKYKLPSLVLIGIDQDVFVKLSRDVAYKLKLTKPGCMLSKFMPSLKGSGKMSASDEFSAIYTSDSDEVIKKKIKSAFSGGQETIEEHRKKGGNPDIDVAFMYLKYFVQENDKKLDEIYKKYKSGKMLTGELKDYTIKRILEFMKEFRKNRKKSEKLLPKFMK
ncbi:MAG: tryptophan--tRNA ligase [Candidatus Woesearchaeota archaeon]